MIDQILVATDGSVAAGAAEAYAIVLAQKLGARLRAVTVVEDRIASSLRSPGLGLQMPGADAVDPYLKSRAEAICKRMVERARAAGVECACETAQGAADDAIAERGRHVDLVVVGRDGEGSQHRTALVGPTTDAVLRKSSKSVLVVPEGAQCNGGVLLAFDGSTGSRIASRIAIHLGTQLGEPAHLFVDSKDKGRSLARFDEVRRLLAGMPTPGREIASTLGRPDVKIVETAASQRAGLIVMGAYGRNRITDYFLGSNAAAVVRTSPVAVLLAR